MYTYVNVHMHNYKYEHKKRKVHQNATCIKSKKVNKYKKLHSLGEKKLSVKTFCFKKKLFALSFYGFSVHVSLCFVLVVFLESKYRL